MKPVTKALRTALACAALPLVILVLLLMHVRDRLSADGGCHEL